jgi:hypothetical protein
MRAAHCSFLRKVDSRQEVREAQGSGPSPETFEPGSNGGGEGSDPFYIVHIVSGYGPSGPNPTDG